MSFVQSKVTRDAASAATVAATFTSNVTAGNLIAVMASWDGNNSHVSGIADSLGNTYTSVDNVSDGVSPCHYRTWYAKNIAGGACTVTLTFTGSRPLREIVVCEISGRDTTAPLGQSGLNLQAAPGTGANGVTSGNKTTTTNGEYIFGCTIAAGSWTINYTGGTGMTVRDNLATSVSERALIHQGQIQTSAGVTAITATTDNDKTMVTAIMTFKATAGPTITSVSTATPREGASLTITGTAFGASQGAGDSTINSISQTETSWGDTQVVSTVVLGTNKFGAAYNVVVTDNGGTPSNSYAGITGLLPATSDNNYVNVGTPNADPTLRLEASADAVSGDQAEWETKGGRINVNADLTFSADIASCLAAGIYSFDYRLWTSGSGYGAWATQTILAVPDAPTIGAAIAGDAAASVSFTAPANNGGATITGYTVTSSPGGITASGASSPISVSGLTNGVAYTFTVKATNAVGDSIASSASNSVTPSGPTENSTESYGGANIPISRAKQRQRDREERAKKNSIQLNQLAAIIKHLGI